MKVLLFARLRELQGASFLELPDEVCPANVAALRASICASATPELAEALRDPNVFCAINQKVVTEMQPVRPGDEIAFFPPMTGG
jgi:molybdopterin converting factor subunit 1